MTQEVVVVHRRRPLAWLGGLVDLAALLVALFIGAAICIAVYDSGRASWVEKGARWLTMPFHGIWNGTIHSSQHQLIANWGTAALVYLVGGLILGGLLLRLSLIGRRRAMVPASAVPVAGTAAAAPAAAPVAGAGVPATAATAAPRRRWLGFERRPRTTAAASQPAYPAGPAATPAGGRAPATTPAATGTEGETATGRPVPM